MPSFTNLIVHQKIRASLTITCNLDYFSRNYNFCISSFEVVKVEKNVLIFYKHINFMKSSWSNEFQNTTKNFRNLNKLSQKKRKKEILNQSFKEIS